MTQQAPPATVDQVISALPLRYKGPGGAVALVRNEVVSFAERCGTSLPLDTGTMMFEANEASGEGLLAAMMGPMKDRGKLRKADALSMLYCIDQPSCDIA